MTDSVRHPFESPWRKAAVSAVAFAAAAGAAVLPAQAAAAAQPEACILQELPMPKGLYFSFVTGMSPDGSVIAYRAYPAGQGGYERYPLLFQDGEMTEVPIPGEDQQVADVNSAGLGVGLTFLDGVELPYVYRDGKVAELPAEDGGAAYGVNEDGDIVGFQGQFPNTPVIWRDGEKEPAVLALPANATSGQARAIDADGTVVGFYEEAGTGNFKPYVWHSDGTGEDLPMPEGVDPATAHSYPNQITDGWIGGYLNTPDATTGIRWNLADGTAEVLGLGTAAGINGEGTAVGDTDPFAAYQEVDGKPVELPGVTDPADNYFGDSAVEISPDGSLIAGHVYAGEDEYGWHILKAVTWTCG
ncbi:hypothetical protein [Glycomyces sp. MUSA5-2]|uniref:hypothetical protein n=1 Tax=Glycomyces sp. MUSA5-2 TaxID=2053002 RepID=UPI00300BA7F0